MKKIIIVLVIIAVFAITCALCFRAANQNSTDIVETGEVKTDVESGEVKTVKNDNELALDTLKNYCKICNYRDYSSNAMPFILDELGFITRDELSDLFESEDPVEGSYYKTPVKYDEFKSKMLEIVTEDYFNTFYSGYKNIDGYVGVTNIGIGIIPVDIDSIISIENLNNNEFLCKVKIVDLEMFDHYKNPIDGETVSEEECYFTWYVIMEKIDDRLLVSDFAHYENGELIRESNELI